MFNNNNSYDDGFGDEFFDDDEPHDEEYFAKVQEINSFQTKLNKGTYVKIPDEIEKYLISYTVSEEQSAATFIAMNKSKCDEISKKPVLSISEESLLAQYRRASGIMTNAAIKDALKSKRKYVGLPDITNYVKNVSKDVYLESLYKDDVVEFLIDENGNQEIKFTDRGIIMYPLLLSQEYDDNTLFADILSDLPSVDELKKIKSNQLKRITDKQLGSNISDVLHQYFGENGDDSSSTAESE